MTELAVVLDRLGDRAELDAPVGPLTTYGVGGSAAALVRPDGPAALEMVAEAITGTDVPVLMVGQGSNLLVHDDGFEGVVVVLGDAFATVEIDQVRVRAGGSARLPVVARRSAAAGLTGFEWAVGVPGSIGGAVRMNAGGHGSDMAASLVAVEVVDLRTGGRYRRSAADLDMGYRQSAITTDEVVVMAELELQKGDRVASETEITEIVRWRREHQPGGHNAGSVFVNPPDRSAGNLIESIGAKGLRLGTAEVSTKHANFIQADEGGSAADVYALMNEICERVATEAGVDLLVETRLIGFPALAGRGDRPASPPIEAPITRGDDQT